ncbi:hypothetical protein FKN04_03895 [Bacillus glycinifermentans]|uniref:hypothetical protein n=1 Tax=Bacillus glycinifermentans TaxID=1664069 RepID=UPI0015838A20|nr:hypothetical protein [Bacillus glycinifermentans]NUJ15763.1 hypothetical protein [Bacillus glycinifermentans]
MNKLTIKTSDKVEVTQAQAWAIEEGNKYYSKVVDGDQKLARHLFVAQQYAIKTGEDEPWEGLFEPLNGLSVYDLNASILKGYTVKEEL